MEVNLFSSKKHVFWQAFFITVLFFLLGLVFGIYLEQGRADSLNVAFYNSEASLYDSFALTNFLTRNPDASCQDVNDAVVGFADRIYEEARQLEQFDDANELTDSVKAIHRKYDLLRTLLWMNTIELKKQCDMNTVVYLYVYDSQDLALKAEQVVWSRILGELKEQEGQNVLLLPIATDQKVSSLDYLMEVYNITGFPAVIINERHVLYEHKTAEELEGLLD